MLEALAAAGMGAVLSFGSMSVLGFSRRTNEGRDAVIRLTVAVEAISQRLDVLHVDLKADRIETFKRLNYMEQRVSRLEAFHQKDLPPPSPFQPCPS